MPPSTRGPKLLFASPRNATCQIIQRQSQSTPCEIVHPTPMCSSYYVIIGSWPFSRASSLSSPSKPNSIVAGRSFFASRAVFSAHARRRTRLLIAASRCWFWQANIALLTLSATDCRSPGCNNAARGGSRLSEGNTRSAMVLSRSSINSLFVGARGASCAVAKFSAGVISPPGVALQVRMSSTS